MLLVQSHRGPMEKHTVSLASYTLRIRRVKHGAFLPLGSFDGTNDFKDFLLEYFNSRKGAPKADEVYRTALETIDCKCPHRQLTASVDAGRYGYQANFWNRKTRKPSGFKRTSDDAELRPYYVLIDVPEKADEAVVLLQRFRNFGIRDILLTDLKSEFWEKFKPYFLEIGDLISSDMVRELFRHGIKEVRYTTFGLHRDEGENVAKGDHTEQEAKFQYIVGAPGSILALSNLDKVLDKELPASKIIEVPRQFKDAAVSVTVDTPSGGKVIEIDKLEGVRPYWDVSNDVKLEDGNPTFESMHEVAVPLLERLRSGTRQRSR